MKGFISLAADIVAEKLQLPIKRKEIRKSHQFIHQKSLNKENSNLVKYIVKRQNLTKL